MTLSLSADAFHTEQGLPHFRPSRPVQPPRARAISIGVTVAAHLLVVAGLVYGIQVTRAPKVEKPIFVDMVKDQKKDEIKPVAPPKFAPPTELNVTPPMIEIAAPPPANAIMATPPRPATPPAPPMPAAPAPVAASAWNGQANYYASLLAYLERFKRYPAAARAAHIEGEVFVHFVMTRDGVVQSAEIAKSSGRPALDREALAMIERAGKLPAMPSEMKGDTLNGVIGPITFSLR
jgi:protein TonB